MDLPCNAAFTVEEFVRMQEKHIAKQSTALQGMRICYTSNSPHELLMEITNSYAYLESPFPFKNQ